MAYTRFNGAKATLQSAASSAVFSDAGITSFSYDGGDRAEIDITTSTSVNREVVAGFRNPRRVSVGLILPAATVAGLDAMIAECAAGTFAVSFGQDCADVAGFLALNVFLMSYSISGQLDSALEVTVELMVDERPA